MKFFAHFNTESPDPCPLCGTKKDGQTLLVGIDGRSNGRVEEAIQVHVDCIELRATDKYGARFIYQRIPERP